MVDTNSKISLLNIGIQNEAVCFQFLFVGFYFILFLVWTTYYAYAIMKYAQQIVFSIHIYKFDCSWLADVEPQQMSIYYVGVLDCDRLLLPRRRIFYQ